eukprot:scaffold13457_cov306-Amphora_coffeaeformis.AAC.3
MGVGRFGTKNCPETICFRMRNTSSQCSGHFRRENPDKEQQLLVFSWFTISPSNARINEQTTPPTNQLLDVNNQGCSPLVA